MVLRRESLEPAHVDAGRLAPVRVRLAAQPPCSYPQPDAGRVDAQAPTLAIPPRAVGIATLFVAAHRHLIGINAMIVLSGDPPAQYLSLPDFRQSGTRPTRDYDHVKNPS
jgi:hypothetical protein